MKKTLFVAAMVVALVLSMSSTAFAAYGINGSSQLSGGQFTVDKASTLSVGPFTKGGTDATITAEAVVTIQGIDIADVTATGWTASTSGANVVLVSPVFDLDADGAPAVSGTVTFGATGNYTVVYSARNASTLAAVGTAATFPIRVNATPASPGTVTRTPSVIGADGASNWTYADLADGANAKYEGGYAAFDDTEFAGDYDNPHGGYDTATNKCKVCHAVHRAEGAYYLLRADSQDDACDYCHVGGSAHSSKVVYDVGGTGTANGHTIGAQSQIPDSTESQWTEEVTLSTTDANGAALNETIEVRAYANEKNEMYRFARHHGHSSLGGARRGYIKVGPLALRCMNCHQVHNAKIQTWQSVAMADMGNAGEYHEGATTSSYKLLKQSPSGTTFGNEDAYGQYQPAQVIAVPETTLTAGVNFDNVRSQGATPGVLTLSKVGAAGTNVNINFARPMWVAQNFDGEHDRDEALAEEAIAASVNNAALSVWCADCHNLNIGGWEHLNNEELGFKAHTERTHPAPYTGAHSGPGQCYSCHRADLPRVNSGDSCSQCHYGTGNYKENRADMADAEYVASDFPHGGDGSYKMLGNYSVNMAAGTDAGRTSITSVTVGADNLDAVCVRCHGGIGTYH